MTEYLLQRTVLTSGVMSAYLYSDTADLIVPTFNSLIIKGKKTERLDVLPGEIEMAELNLSVVEDYLNYVEGFWYNVLHVGKPQIKILLDEGNGNTLYFWGTIQDKTVNFSETCLIAGYERRSGSLRCVTMLDSFKEITSQALMNYCEANILLTGPGTYSDWKFVKLREMLAAILKVGNFNAAFDAADVVLPTPGECDMSAFINNYPSGTFTYTWSELYIPFSALTIRRGAVAEFTESFSDAFEILKEVCKAFGFVPNFYYNLTDSKWKLALSTRGSTYSGSPVTMPVSSRSDNLVNVDQTVTAVLVTNGNKFADAGTNTAWVKKGIFHVATYFQGYWNYAPIPPMFSPEISLDLMFGIMSVFSPAGAFDFLLFGYDGVDFKKITKITVYRYDISSTEDVISLEHALCLLLYYRFNRSRKGFEREYPSMSATLSGVTSHENLHLLSCTSIDDRVSAKTYYATDVSQDLFANTASIKWAQADATTVGDEANASVFQTPSFVYTTPEQLMLTSIVSLDDETVFYDDEIVLN